MESWLAGCLKKRSPDAIRILCDLITAGIKKGECSALDVRDVAFDQPNIIGGVFKILHKFGFTHSDRRIKSTVTRKHARRVDVWIVSDMSKLQSVYNQMQSIIIPTSTNQLSLF